MVRAVLDGRKSQTRRMMKAQPPENCNDPAFDCSGYGFFHEGLDSDGDCFDSWPKGDSGISCPYGVPGDKLWVRETWQAVSGSEEWIPIDECRIIYKATDEHPGFEASDYADVMNLKPFSPIRDMDIVYPWRPSIHMPKKFARIWLEITNIRVESVQDISEKDAKAEGAELYNYDGTKGGWGSPTDYISAFRILWDSCYGHGAWERNGWVWVIEFKLLTEGKDEHTKR